VSCPPRWVGGGVLGWAPPPRGPPTAQLARTADGKERRDRGFVGLLIGVLASFVVSVLVMVLNMALGDWWMPSAGSLY
jgi:hypothetical protein